MFGFKRTLSRLKDPHDIQAARKCAVVLILVEALACIVIVMRVPCKPPPSAQPRHTSGLVCSGPAMLRRYRNRLGGLHGASAYFPPGKAAEPLLQEAKYLALQLLHVIPCNTVPPIAHLGIGIWVQGQRDYTLIKGQTGPLVYPAGFLYAYSLLFHITAGGRIILAQSIFAVIYLANQAVVMWLYVESHAVPPWALILLCLSKRVHSIFLLRMFNDGLTMLLANLALLLLIKQKWRWSLVTFSGALSVKMNVLLLAPPVGVILLQVSILPPSA